MTVGGARQRRMAVLVVLALLTVTLTPTASDAAPKKSFTLDVAATDGTGDAGVLLTLTLTNTSRKQQLGSANVTVPDVLQVVSAPDDTDPSTPQVIELRDLDIPPGGARTFEVSANVAGCTTTTAGPFEAEAKQSNRFNGTGNDLRLDVKNSTLTVEVSGTCTVAFVNQPGDAERGAEITSDDFDPSGAPIVVEIQDAAGNRVATSGVTIELSAENGDGEPVELGGTTSATTVDGVATFDPGPTLSPSAFEYTLIAEADFGATATSTSATSNGFDIVDNAVTCPAGEPCATPATAARDGQRITAVFGTGAEAVSLTVSLGAEDAPDITCKGEVSDDNLVAQYLFFGGNADDRDGQIRYTIPADGRSSETHGYYHHRWHHKEGLGAYEVCWAAPYNFEAEGGTTTATATKPDGDTRVYVGILPDCARYGEPTTPCVSDRDLNRKGTKVTFTIEADGRDPWARS